ncbi:hypothetical protein [Amycolatopsis sp. NPDC058986]|uniref:hypothetical protein n=1 Tax=unclassified Amycolatopsis TaxID=2618356 RepID=UPI00366D4CE9
MPDQPRFVVLLYPKAASDGWCARVICNEGPTSLLAARPQRQARAAAAKALEDMLIHMTGPCEVQVFTAEVTEAFAADIAVERLFPRLDREYAGSPDHRAGHRDDAGGDIPYAH